MTSKRSSRGDSSNLSFMGYTKRRIAAAALIALYTVLGYIVFPIFALSQRSRQYYMWYNYPGTAISFDQFMKDGARNILGYCSFLSIGVIVLAVIVGLQSFHWLYKTQSVDFYESQPIKRIRRFRDIMLNSMFLYAVSTAVGTVISILICSVFGATNGVIIAEIVCEYFRLLILFFSLQAISVLAEMLSKNIIISVIVDAIFLSGEFLIRMLIHEMKEAYFITFYEIYYEDPRNSISCYITSPIGNLFNGHSIAAYIQMDGNPTMSQLKDVISSVWSFDLISLIIGLVAMSLAYVVYSKRNSEAIGNGVIYEWLSSVLKFLMLIPLGVFAGLAVDYMFETTHYRITAMLVLMIAIVVVILAAIIEIIHAGTIKAIAKRIWQIPIIFVLSLTIMIVFKYDLCGYDSYVPKADKIRDFALYGNWGYRDFYVAGTDDAIELIYPDEYFNKYMHLDDIDEIRQIAAEGQAVLRSNELARTKYTIENENGNYSYPDNVVDGNDMYVIYHMKDGTTVNRRLIVPNDTDRTPLLKITGNSDYKEIIYQTNFISEYVSQFAIAPELSYDCGYGTNTAQVDKAGLKKFLSAYRKDLEMFDYGYAMDHTPIGLVSYSDPAGTGYSYLQFEVYEDYSETIDWLHKNGIWMEAGIPEDRVSSVELTDYEYDELDTYIGSRTLTLTDPVDISRISGSVINQNVNTLWYNNDDTDTLNVYFYIKPGFSPSNNEYENMYGGGYGGFFIPRKNVPPDILERLYSMEMTY